MTREQMLNIMMQGLREYKIWGGHREESDAIYLWAYCTYDALYAARCIDPDVYIVQWTGKEER